METNERKLAETLVDALNAHVSKHGSAGIVSVLCCVLSSVIDQELGAASVPDFYRRLAESTAAAIAQQAESQPTTTH